MSHVEVRVETFVYKCLHSKQSIRFKAFKLVERSNNHENSVIDTLREATERIALTAIPYPLLDSVIRDCNVYVTTPFNNKLAQNWFFVRLHI